MAPGPSQPKIVADKHDDLEALREEWHREIQANKA